MKCPYGTVKEQDTTADIAVQIKAKSLSNLFSAAGWAYTNLVADISKIKPDVNQTVCCQSDDLTMLMVDWLAELIFIFETKQLLFSKFDTIVKNSCLQTHMAGQKSGLKPDEYRMDIKAVTWHGLEITNKQGLYQTRIIFDV